MSLQRLRGGTLCYGYTHTVAEYSCQSCFKGINTVLFTQRDGSPKNLHCHLLTVPNLYD